LINHYFSLYLPPSSWWYYDYTDALVLDNRFDSRTQSILEGLFGVDKALGRMDSLSAIKVQTHLALVYQHMDNEPSKQKLHTENVVRHMHKHPHLGHMFSCFLKRKNRPPHPVAVALGPQWLCPHQEPYRSPNDKGAVQNCRHCRANARYRALTMRPMPT